jgi:aquaporin TIP
MDKNLRGYVVELIGTFAVVYLSAAAVCSGQIASLYGYEHMSPGLVGMALAYGLAYAVALAATLPYSQGYLNPAITLMLWVFKKLDGPKTTALIFVQLLGAAVAGGLIRLAFTPFVLGQARFGTPHLNLKMFEGKLDAMVLLKGVALELGMTFVLTFIIYATIMDPRVPKFLGDWGRKLIGFWVGLALVAITIAGFPFTGAAVNPARWFGTVIWERTISELGNIGPFSDHMVFWFGPIAGALLAGFVYNVLILPADEEQTVAESAGRKMASPAATLFKAKKKSI